MDCVSEQVLNPVVAMAEVAGSRSLDLLGLGCHAVAKVGASWNATDAACCLPSNLLTPMPLPSPLLGTTDNAIVASPAYLV